MLEEFLDIERIEESVWKWMLINRNFEMQDNESVFLYMDMCPTNGIVVVVVVVDWDWLERQP